MTERRNYIITEQGNDGRWFLHKVVFGKVTEEQIIKMVEVEQTKTTKKLGFEEVEEKEMWWNGNLD